MKRVTFFLIVLTGILLLSSGCRFQSAESQAETPESPVSMQASDHSPDEPCQVVRDNKPLIVCFSYSYERFSGRAALMEAQRIFNEISDIEVEFYHSADHEETDIDVVIVRACTADNTPGLFKEIASGAYRDLNEMIANDWTFDPGKYGAVMDAGAFNDGRYVIPLSYNIPVLLTSEEKMAKLGFSVDDFSTLDGFITSWETLQTKGVPAFTNSANWYDMVLNSGWFDEYIDFESCAVDLERPSFRQLTELMKRQWQAPPTEQYRVKKYAYIGLDGAGGLYSGLFDIVPNVREFMRYLEIIDDLVLLPVPNAKGRVTAVVESYCMIPVASDNPEGAWMFIKSLLSDEAHEAAHESATIFSYIHTGSERLVPCFDSEFSVGFDWMYNKYLSYVDHGLNLDLQEYNDMIMNVYKSCDNAVIPYSKGGLVFSQVFGYISADSDDFDTLKNDAEDYFSVFFS